MYQKLAGANLGVGHRGISVALFRPRRKHMATPTAAALDTRRRVRQPLAHVDAMFYFALGVMAIGTFVGVFLR